MEEEYSNKQFQFGDITGDHVEVFGTNEEPYFKARDVAQMLEYKYPANAIQEHVTSKNKKTLRELHNISNMGLAGYPEKIIKLPKLKGNDSGSIYISESGLYQLIFASKMKKAKIFQIWICEDVLPKIRLYGCYDIAEYGISDIKIHLKRIAKENNIIGPVIEKVDPKVVEKKVEVTVINKKKSKGYITKIDSTLFPKARNIKTIDTDGFIIISTNALQKVHSLYKVNFVKKIKIDQNYEILSQYKTINGKNIENQIYTSLRNVTYGVEKDIFCIEISLLEKLVKKCCDNNIKYNNLLSEFKSLNCDKHTYDNSIVPNCLNWFYSVYSFDKNYDNYELLSIIAGGFFHSTEFKELPTDILKNIDKNLLLKQLLLDDLIKKYYHPAFENDEAFFDHFRKE